MIKFFKLKLKIAGKETPIVSADITSGDSILESAVITIPSTEYSSHFVRGLNIEIYSKIDEDGPWLLEFFGEITGRGYSRSTRGSSTSIIAMGHGNLWRRIQEYVYNAVPSTLKQIPIPETVKKTSLTGLSFDGYFTSLLRDHGKDIQSAIESVFTRHKGNEFRSRGKNVRTLKKFVPKNDEAEASTLFSKLVEAVRLDERIFVGSGDPLDSYVDLLLQLSVFAGLQLTSIDGITNIMEVGLSLINRFYYKFSSIAQATYLAPENIIPSYICKLSGELAIPPQCNVVFPNRVVSVSYSEDYLNAPTRVLTRVKDIISQITRETTSLLDHYHVGPSKDGHIGGGVYKDYLFDGNGVSDLSEYEKVYGTNIVQIGMDSSLIAAKPKEISHIMNHEFYKRHFSSRTISATFDPSVNIVPGAPVLIMDGDKFRKHILAYCPSVRRTFTASGELGLTVTLTHPRFYNELENIFDGFTSLLKPGDLGEIYRWIGSEPVASSDKELSEKIDELSKRYYEGDPMYDYGQRDRCTEEDLVEKMKLESEGNAKGMAHDSYRASEDGGKPGEVIVPTVTEDVINHNKQLALIGLNYDSRN